MRHRLVIASAAALVIAASCATAPATEENTLPQPLAPRSSVRLQPVPSARAPETTGTLSTTQGAMETAKADSEARRVTEFGRPYARANGGNVPHGRALTRALPATGSLASSHRDCRFKPPRVRRGPRDLKEPTRIVTCPNASGIGRRSDDDDAHEETIAHPRRVQFRELAMRHRHSAPVGRLF